jgi:FAD/FMN-containing dehydrogenase
MTLSSNRAGDPALAARLRKSLRGEVLFDAFSRGRYSTDASIYQIEPVGVVVPRDRDDVAAALAVAREEGVTVLPRGGGTSQCGQTVGPSLVLDCSKYMSGIVSVDAANRRAIVQPGLVLDRLNKILRKDGLFFPVDVSTSSRATLGGMAANNSCGSRSLRYGNMVHNVRAIDAILADGTAAHFGETATIPRCRSARATSSSGCGRCTAAKPPRSTHASPSSCARSAATTST